MCEHEHEFDSFTCCCIPHDSTRLTNFNASRFEGMSRWKFISPTMIVSLSSVACLSRNVGHSLSKNTFVFRPFSFVVGGLYTTAMRTTNPFIFNWQSMCSNCKNSLSRLEVTIFKVIEALYMRATPPPRF